MTMLGGKSSGAGSFEVVENKPAAASGGAAPAKSAPAAKGSSFDNFDDDIPF
jgi:single-stranded DNA-binding protein